MSVRAARSLLSGLVLAMLVGCAYQRDYRVKELKLKDIGPVAVVPFENLSGNPNAGAIVTELFQAELYATNMLELVPSDNVAAKLATASGENRTPQQLGEVLNAKSLLVGRVTEYAYKRGLGEEPAIGVSIRLVDASTGKVLWSGARSAVGGRSPFSEDSLSRLGQVICNALASTLVGE